MSFIRRIFGSEPDDNLRIVITRHGERADFALGKDWLHQIQANGGHHPNVPQLTQRPNFREWSSDPPLTLNGEQQSALVGKKIRNLGLTIDYCYSSPAYRSVQTANKILESQGRKAVPINIEPGLFECSAWYKNKPLSFIPPTYLARDRRFNINTQYAPFASSVDPYEDEKEYYKRSRRLIREIIRAHKYTGGTVLLAGHGGSIEAVTRGLRGFRHRRGRPEHLVQEAMRVDYCNFAILERDARTRDWTVRLPQSSGDPYGAQLSNQSIIPLYGISTQHITRPTVQRLPSSRRAHQQHHHHQQQQHRRHY